MITSSSSPTFHANNFPPSPSHPFSSRTHHENHHRPQLAQSATSRGNPIPQAGTNATTRELSTNSPLAPFRQHTAGEGNVQNTAADRLGGRPKQMNNASTQYSPPPSNPVGRQNLPSSGVANLQLGVQSTSLVESPKAPAIAPRSPDQSMTAPLTTKVTPASTFSAGAKRSTSDISALVPSPPSHDPSAAHLLESEEEQLAKRHRPPKPAVKLMPKQYEHCNPKDLTVLISSMLMELIRYNDIIPLRDGHLTRFHSRAPPAISVLDYLQRLTTHATLSSPILLSMVFYIDRLCALYPAFTISSLTVHRFLITSATVASKGLSDSFWTNKLYARVGGVKLKELALLELEFLWRVEWRIVPRPEVLVDYYRSLVERSDGYEIQTGDVPAEQSMVLDKSGKVEAEAEAEAETEEKKHSRRPSTSGSRDGDVDSTTTTTSSSTSDGDAAP